MGNVFIQFFQFGNENLTIFLTLLCVFPAQKCPLTFLCWCGAHTLWSEVQQGHGCQPCFQDVWILEPSWHLLEVSWEQPTVLCAWKLQSEEKEQLIQDFRAQWQWAGTTQEEGASNERAFRAFGGREGIWIWQGDGGLRHGTQKGVKRASTGKEGR